MILRNSEVKAARTRSSAEPRAIALTVVRRRQAPEEERRFRAAADALLTELVRRQMGREDIEHG